MGTKNNPTPNDCHARAEPDEPLFTLLARDPVAAHLVSIWAKLRMMDYDAAEIVWRDLVRKHFYSNVGRDIDMDKVTEAMECSRDMFEWIKKNRPERALNRVD